MKTCINLIFMFFAVLTVFSCRGEDGEDGDPGENGNTNVIVSDWKFSTLPKDTVIDNTTVRVVTVAAPELTAARHEKSVVYVYLDYGGGPFPLPFTSRNGNRTSTITYFTKVGKVRPIRIPDDGGATLSIPSFIQFRYLIIPSGSLKNSSQVDYNDYEAVKKYYNIKD